MTDLKDMMEGMSLDQCQAEIGQQVRDITAHNNCMKRAVLLSILGEQVLDALKQEQPDKYPQKLQERLSGVIKQYEDSNELREAKENINICNSIERLPDALRDVHQRISALIKEYNELLAETIRTRDGLSVEEAKKAHGTA